MAINLCDSCVTLQQSYQLQAHSERTDLAVICTPFPTSPVPSSALINCLVSQLNVATDGTESTIYSTITDLGSHQRRDFMGAPLHHE